MATYHPPCCSLLLLYVWCSLVFQPGFAVDIATGTGSYMTFNKKNANYKQPLYGNLERKSRQEGRLEFKKGEADEEALSIYLRLSPRLDYRYWSDTEYELAPFDIISASVFSLAFTLDALSHDMRKRTQLHLLVNAADPEIVSALQVWTSAVFGNRTGLLNIVECPTGKVPSKECMLDLVVDHAAAGLSERTILYFIESDYLHHASATQEIVDIFASHNPCIAVPYDYADRYFRDDVNPDLGAITLFAGKNRHWRSISCVTSTFAIRLENFIQYFDELPFPKETPGNDFRASQRLYNMGVSMVSPLPSLAAHINSLEYIDQGEKRYFEASTEYVSLYFNWFAMARNLRRYAQDLEINMWNLLGNPTFRLEVEN
mmetsp:Transcript_26502/g.44798  ORF Transcript_26502/g.44798 Transcript_26502/m.44798 type:complete len:373 (+) Transcript_26502:76-1194(+)